MEDMVKEGTLGAVLFKSRIITEVDIERALAEQRDSGCRFGEALVKLGIVTQEDIDWALSHQLNIPYVRLNKDMIDPGAVSLVSADMARQYNLIPLIRTGDELNVALADPLNEGAIEAVERTTGCSVSVSVGLIREIREMQDIFYGPLDSRKIIDFVSEFFTTDVLDSINNDSSCAKLLDHLLLLTHRRNFAALSLQPLGDRVQITARRNGSTHEIGSMASGRYPDLLLLIRKMSGINATPEISATGKIGFRFREQTVTFQVLLLRTMEGNRVTLKLHSFAPFPAFIGGLGLAPDQDSSFRALVAATKGMTLFLVQDALERSRLLNLFLNECDSTGRNILLVGEGFEEGVRHFPRVPVHERAHPDSSAQVMAVLEHDPDVIVIEDVTESHTFIAASRAALRGKLVLSGVAWHDTAEALRHLFYFRHKNHFIAGIINGIVACRSVLTICPQCKVEADPTPEERAVLPPAPPCGYFRGAGCPSCDHTGYEGKKFLLEVIPFDQQMLQHFASANDSTHLVQYLKDRGGRSIRQQGEEMLNAGEITAEEYISSIIF